MTYEAIPFVVKSLLIISVAAKNCILSLGYFSHKSLMEDISGEMENGIWHTYFPNHYSNLFKKTTSLIRLIFFFTGWVKAGTGCDKSLAAGG